MFQLRYQDHIYRQAQDFQNQEIDLPEFAQAAFLFCKAWLTGAEQFSQKTSGSTGTPKQITISRDQMLASAKATGDFFSARSDWKLLCCLNPQYIAGKMMLVRAMLWDCEIELVAPSSNPILEVLTTSNLDFAALVPLQIEAALQDPNSKAKLKKIGHILIGSAPTSAKLKSQLVLAEVNAFQTFGMTETVSHIALAKITEDEFIYQTLPGVRIGTTDNHLLWVKSKMSGPDLIQTNDEVKLLSAHSFSWLGRADFTINSGGVKLHPELLEHTCEQAIQETFPGVSFFFAGQPDEQLGQKLVLVLENKSLDEKKLNDLKQSLKLILNRFEMPKAFIFKNKFIRTPTGKLDRLTTLAAYE